MRNNKIIMPLFLILILFGSVCYAFSSRREAIENYNAALASARDYAEKGVYLDAITSYKTAVSLHPSVDISYEIGTTLLKSGDKYSAKNWYESMVSQYPKETKTYLYGIQAFLADKRYSAAFGAYEDYQKRGLNDPEIETLVDEFRYAYKLTNQYDDAEPFSNINNLAAVKYQGDWGYADISGEKKIGYRYAKAGVFSQYAAVVDLEGNACYIDSSGNVKITEAFILDKDPEFGTVQEFGPYQGNAIWAYNGKIWNAYDINSFEKLFGGYAGAYPFCNGVAAVSNGNKWALISTNGEMITDYIYDEVLADGKQNICRTNAILVRAGESYFMVNRSGERICEDTYSDACAFFDATLAAVKLNGKWCFADETGAVAFATDYEAAMSFSGGFAAVQKNGKWGYISADGVERIACNFEEVDPFNLHGSAFVLNADGRWKILQLYMFNHD